MSTLRDAAGPLKKSEFTYRSEWLGYLPSGLYHWVETDGTDISHGFPRGWQKSDLLTLEQAEHLRIISEWQDPDDAFHQRVVFVLI